MIKTALASDVARPTRLQSRDGDPSRPELASIASCGYGRFTALTFDHDSVPNALTVDVEEHFQVGAFERYVPRESWVTHESRVEVNTFRLLELFERHHAKATFFFLGWVAERHPQLVAEVHQLGHEVASHGWDHVRVNQFTPEQLRDDLQRTRSLLEDVTGAPVLGYRAPNFSIGDANPWALDIVAEQGHVYDCSIRQASSAIRAWPHLPSRYELDSGRSLLAFPLSTLAVGRRRVPFTGGNYLRQLPSFLGHWGLRRINRSGLPGMLYIHPWEVDPDQPRVDVDLLTRVRHYRNLDKTHARLEALLTRFRFDTVRGVLRRANETASLLEPALARFEAQGGS